MHSCSGHDTVIINIVQPFKFAVSNSAPTTHFGMHSEDPQRHNGHHRTDIADFGPIPGRFWFYDTIMSLSCHNELNPYYRTKIGKIVLIVPITTQLVSRAPAKLCFLDRIGLVKFERLLTFLAQGGDYCTIACDILYPHRQIYWPYYWFKICRNLIFFTSCWLLI